MSGQSRSSKWREERIAKGGKAVGVTLEPGAAESLDTLQEMFKWSQREAISFALEFTARHKDQIDVSKHFQKVFLETFNPRDLLDKMTRLEGKTKALENEVASLRELVSAASISAATQSSREKEDAVFAQEAGIHEGGRPEDTNGWEPLLEFTARQMLEHGERMTKSRLFETARHEHIPIHPTQHEFSSFLSRNMNKVRDILRQLKEGTI